VKLVLAHSEKVIGDCLRDARVTLIVAFRAVVRVLMLPGLGEGALDVTDAAHVPIDLFSVSRHWHRLEHKIGVTVQGALRADLTQTLASVTQLVGLQVGWSSLCLHAFASLGALGYNDLRDSQIVLFRGHGRVAFADRGPRIVDGEVYDIVAREEGRRIGMLRR